MHDFLPIILIFLLWFLKDLLEFLYSIYVCHLKCLKICRSQRPKWQSSLQRPSPVALLQQACGLLGAWVGAAHCMYYMLFLKSNENNWSQRLFCSDNNSWYNKWPFNFSRPSDPFMVVKLHFHGFISDLMASMCLTMLFTYFPYLCHQSSRLLYLQYAQMIQISANKVSQRAEELTYSQKWKFLYIYVLLSENESCLSCFQISVEIKSIFPGQCYVPGAGVCGDLCQRDILAGTF